MNKKVLDGEARRIAMSRNIRGTHWNVDMKIITLLPPYWQNVVVDRQVIIFEAMRNPINHLIAPLTLVFWWNITQFDDLLVMSTVRRWKRGNGGREKWLSINEQLSARARFHLVAFVKKSQTFKVAKFGSIVEKIFFSSLLGLIEMEKNSEEKI